MVIFHSYVSLPEGNLFSPGGAHEVAILSIRKHPIGGLGMLHNAIGIEMRMYPLRTQQHTWIYMTNI